MSLFYDTSEGGEIGVAFAYNESREKQRVIENATKATITFAN